MKSTAHHFYCTAIIIGMQSSAIYVREGQGVDAYSIFMFALILSLIGSCMEARIKEDK